MNENQKALLSRWYDLLPQLESAKAVIAEEQELRKQLSASFFPTPKEGTNVYPLGNGYKLKYAHKIDRKVDGDALAVSRSMLGEIVDINSLFEYRPSLSLANYRELTAEQQLAVDRVLIIKPGSGTLTIETPKAPKNASV